MQSHLELVLAIEKFSRFFFRFAKKRKLYSQENVVDLTIQFYFFAELRYYSAFHTQWLKRDED